MQPLRSVLIAAALATASSVLVTASGPGLKPQMDDTPRQIFLQRVDGYVALHRRLEANLPREVITADPHLLFESRIALGREIRRARSGAHQGEIFTPAVAKYFRHLVEKGLRESGVENLLELVEEENSVATPPAVNGEYPAGRSLCFMPPRVLAVLPPLPKELEYQFVGQSLILWDVHAGLIVDFAPGVFRVLTEP
jgi:hypothetical protein